MIVLVRLRDRDPARLFGSPRAMSIGLLVVALLLGVISLITTIGLQVVEKRIRMAEGNAIDSVLYTTQKGSMPGLRVGVSALNRWSQIPLCSVTPRHC